MQSLRDTDPAAFAQYMRAKYGEPYTEDDARRAAAVCAAADAHLAAAAPDLLENLHQLVNLLESIGHDCTPAREVIARATGA